MDPQELIEVLVASIRARERLEDHVCPHFKWCPGHDICTGEECQRLWREDGDAWERASQAIRECFPDSKEMTRSVKCDQCSKELDSSRPHSWGLLVKAVDYGINTTGVTYAIMDEPPYPFSRDHHFCSTSCLAEFIAD